MPPLKTKKRYLLSCTLIEAAVCRHFALMLSNLQIEKLIGGTELKNCFD